MSELNGKIIAKFLAGECTEEELIALKNWVEESDSNARELFTSEELYHLGKQNASSQEKLLEEGEKRLRQSIIAEQQTLRKRALFRQCMQYAAIIIVSFLVGGVGYWGYKTVTHKPEPLVRIVAGNAARELMLPDGTKVWLNRNTVLQYSKGFAGEYRQVYLDGEGFFEVKRNPEKPFIVQSKAMQVRVLGTVFNMKSGKNGQKAVATLLQGEVEVKGNHGEGMIVLSPGQQAELDGTTRRLSVKPAEVGVEGWHGTKFDLKQTDVYTLCKLLERAYDVRIILAPGIDSTQTYTGPLKKKETVEETLDLIKSSLGINYKIVGGNIFLSSSKSKSKSK